MTTPVLELAEVPQAIEGASDEINDAFRRLDIVVQLAVLDKDLTTPPASPVQGDRYIIPSGATGVWANRAPRIAYYTVEGWRYATPRNGWLAWVSDEARPYWFRQATNEWTLFQPGGGGGGGGSGAVGRSPDDIPETPDPADDEFEIDGAIDTAGDRFTGSIPWQWRNQGGATAVATSGSLILTAPGTTGHDHHIVEQVAATAPWTYRCKIAVAGTGSLNNAGLYIANNSNGRLIHAYRYINSFPTDAELAITRLTDVNTAAGSNVRANSNVENIFGGINQWGYWELENTGTMLIWRYSSTGVPGSFIQLGTELISNFIGSVDRIGIGADARTVSDVVAICDWFRRVA